EVGVVRERELAVDRQAAERRRADVEDDVLVLRDDDLVAGGGHLAVRPRGRIGPSRLRAHFLGSQEHGYADGQERIGQERATLFVHEMAPHRFGWQRISAEQTIQDGLRPSEWPNAEEFATGESKKTQRRRSI